MSTALLRICGSQSHSVLPFPSRSLLDSATTTLILRTSTAPSGDGLAGYLEKSCAVVKILTTDEEQHRLLLYSPAHPSRAAFVGHGHPRSMHPQRAPLPHNVSQRHPSGKAQAAKVESLLYTESEREPILSSLVARRQGAKGLSVQPGTQATNRLATITPCQAPVRFLAICSTTAA